jgi:superfamily I DNA/RNA helicase
LFKLTDEQRAILEKTATMKQGEIVLVNALAGCAKTSTLKMIAQQNPHSRFLYLAFNRKIVDEAVQSFPLNTKATTLHALARGYTGRKTLKYLNMDMIKEILNSEIGNSSDYFKVFNAQKAYQNFCQSAFSIDELDELKVDVRKKMKEDFTKRIKNKNMDFIINQRVDAIDLVEEIHNSILNSNFTTFDTFLKEFVESADERTFNYDYIVLDESQDVSKLLAKFILSLVKSKRYKIIIVGDNNQKIYGFLGNTNLALVLEQLYPNDVVLMRLNRSFRFQKDSKIEQFSNRLLELRGEKIIGARVSVPAPSPQDRVAYLSRSTFPLLAMSIHQILNEKPYHLYGGVSNFNIEEIKDIYNLYIYTKELKRRLDDELIGLTIEEKIKKLADKRDEKRFPKIKSNSLKAFSSFTELENFASSRAIFELENNISIVYFIYTKKRALEDIEEETSEDIVNQFFSLIDTHSNPYSNTIISTIHKSKGLEFESVTILKSLVVYATNDEISSVSSENGNILGLTKVGIDFSRKYRSNQELVELLNSAEKSDGNIFKKRKRTESIEISAKDSEKRTPKIANELIINQKMSNIKEEYNILYVAITRAIRDIQISNVNYIETLDFLEFINKNLNEIIKISQGEASPLVIEIEKKEGKGKKIIDKGIIYEDCFISITTLLALLEEL